MARSSTIVIAAGGTAGHVVPALAVARALQAEGTRVVFLGAGRAEAELVPAAGFELHGLSLEGIDRANPARAVRALALAAAALPRARALLRRLDPGAVLGAGGYVAGPVGAAAIAGRIPLVLSEADAHLGLTNRLLAPFADRVCLAFALPGRDGARYRLTGRPVMEPDADRARARSSLGIGEEETSVLVFGGSQGARSINLAAVEAFADAGFHVLHLCGRRDFPELSSRELRAGYDLRAYLELDAFGAALAAADLVVARAGGSVFEIAAYGRPSILIPYPHATADHQGANARWMTAAGAALTIPDGELGPERLREQVQKLLADGERLAAMSAAARALARPQAAREIAEELLEAARR